MAATLINSPNLFSSSSRRSYFSNGLSGVVTCQKVSEAKSPIFTKNVPSGLSTRNRFSGIPRSSGSSSSDGNLEDPKALAQKEKACSLWILEERCAADWCWSYCCRFWFRKWTGVCWS
ncbi:Uncharacterized protein M6B38_247755 [Iris pallida]|uniref:Uncharacterized protein n=1 Tax=Iris pallida TaxID=29817 RepID=A0AAX6DG71_IRIPA|nr:Uncharacterized protein M6B38_247755 [Iris pallida]